MTANALPLTVPDVVCTDDVDQYARETTSDLETLVQDVFHILIELPGTNIDDPDRGVGVEALLSGSAANIGTVQKRIEAQLLRDDRIDACTTEVSSDPDSGTYNLAITIQVDGSVVGLSFAYDAASGLSLVSWGVQS